MTSPGPAAIAVMRLRGAPCGAFLRSHVRARSKTDPDTWTTGRVLRAELLDENGEPIDDILVSITVKALPHDIGRWTPGCTWG